MRTVGLCVIVLGVVGGCGSSGGSDRAANGSSETTPDEAQVSEQASTSTTRPSESDAPLTSPQQRALENLTTVTGVRWSIEQHSRLATPAFLAPPRGQGPRALGTTWTEGTGLVARPLARAEAAVATKATLDFLTRHKELFRMRAPARELTVRNGDTAATMIDELAMTHVRLAQVERGVPVIGGELYAHYDDAGRLSSIQGHYVPDLDRLSIDPKVSAAMAQQVVMADAEALAKTTTTLGGQRKSSSSAPISLTTTSAPRLVVFAVDASSSSSTTRATNSTGRQGRQATLAWEIPVREADAARRAWLVTVDAQTGRVLDRMDQSETLKGSGVGVKGDTKALEYTQFTDGLFLDDKSHPAEIQTFDLQNGTDLTKAVLVSSTAPTAWDTRGPAAGAAVDAHVLVGVVYDFYKNTLGRKGWDDKDVTMQNVVHDGTDPDNASYNQIDNVMRFGDGKDIFEPLAGSLDVMAHEYTHAITFNTSALRYETQSGALNEAISDIFGAIVEHAVRPDPVNNWLIGEGFVKGDVALRSMTDPHSAKIGPQPSHMKELVNTQQDNGGVHTNSGIVNKAAHLMTVGGTHSVSKVTVTNPIGFDKLAKVWYRANQRYLIASSDFALAAKATMEAATDLKLPQGDLDTIDCAWKAVGVVQGDCAKPASTGGAPATGDDQSPKAPTRTEGGDDTPSTSPTPKKPKAADGAPRSTAQNAGCSAATTTTSNRSEGAPWWAFVAIAVGATSMRRRRET